MAFDPELEMDRLLLTEEDRARAVRLRESRASVAKKFTVLATIPVAGFGVRLLAAPASWQMVAVWVAVLVVAASLVWWFGWRQLKLIDADLQGGHKGRLRGTLERVDRQQNAYGELVTHATVAGLRVTSREPTLAAMPEGTAVVLEVLPSSRVVLSVSLSQ